MSARVPGSPRLWGANLVLPGVGLILAGRVAAGLAIGLLFVVLANGAVAATLLVPDDVSPWVQALVIGLAAGTYVGAQLRLRYALEDTARAARRDRRDAALRVVRACVERGDGEAGWEALRPVAEDAEEDLLVAYRVAQVLTLRGDRTAARIAWERVRRLDRHHLYREAYDAQMAALRSDAGRGAGA
jgi:hypothetical protein